MSLLNNKKKKPAASVARTVQQSIPIIACYEDGMLQLAPGGRFSRAYRIDDASFDTLSRDDKESVCIKFGEFLNSLDPEGSSYAFYFVNSPCDKDEILEKVAPHAQNDGKNDLRDEITQILSDKIEQSRNNYKTEKYFAVSVDADSVDAAVDKLRQQDAIITSGIAGVAGAKATKLSLAQTLELLSRIYNGPDTNTEYFEHDIDGNTSIDWKEVSRAGKKTKDIIMPSAFRFTGNDMQIGDRQAQALYMDGFSNYITPKFITTMTETAYASVIALHIVPLETDEALRLLKRASVAKSAELVDREQKAERQGVNPSHVAKDIRDENDQIQYIQDIVKNDDQRCFYFYMTMLHFAPDKQTLALQTKKIRQAAQSQTCSAKVLAWQQERGLNSCLPIAHTTLPETISRFVYTEALEVFQPFKEITLLERGGSYYGTNPINGALICIDRRNSDSNYNAALLGRSGAGKSFTACKEISMTFLSTSDDILVVDPDGDYVSTCNAFGGQVIEVAPGSQFHINPFDLDIDTSSGEGGSPMERKTAFIKSLVETMIGAETGLGPEQNSIIDQCVRDIYRTYAEHLAALPPDITGRKRTIDRDEAPTFENLFDALMQKGANGSDAAQWLACAIEPYVNGALSMFSRRTNVDIDNRFVCFDLHDSGAGMGELATKIVTEFIFNRMLENRRRGVFTRAYFDEFHLMLRTPSSAAYYEDMWKRVRKRYGMPMLITQNISDLLASPSGDAILRNTSFFILLGMETNDREDIAKILPNISPSNIDWLGVCDRGCGLVYSNGRAVRFVDKFPENTRLFKIWTKQA